MPKTITLEDDQIALVFKEAGNQSSEVYLEKGFDEDLEDYPIYSSALALATITAIINDTDYFLSWISKLTEEGSITTTIQSVKLQ